MTSELDFSLKLAFPDEPLHGDMHLLYGLLEVYGGSGAGVLPSNLGFVIDTSDSMRIRLVTETQFAQLVKSGHAQEVMTDGIPAYQISSIPDEMISKLPRRIDFVADALKAASDVLRDNDYFSLIAFASQAQRLIEQTPGKMRARLRQAALILDSLKLGDETQMDEGLAMAFEEVRRLPGKDYASRLILLTDGHTRNVDHCYEWAEKARQAGIKLTTMGIGSEFNEDLLIPLADLTGGNAYYIETPDKVDQVFTQELGSALHISYRNMEVKVNLAAGIKIRQVFRVMPELGNFEIGQDMRGSYSLLIGDYDPASPVALLLEFEIPEGKMGISRLAQTMLAWDDPAGGIARQNLRKEVVVNPSQKESSYRDETVIKIVEKVHSYQMGIQALEAAQGAGLSASREEKNAATVRLRQAATHMLDMGEVTLAGTMFQQADMLERSGNLDPEAAKKLRYETRRLARR
jgi:Ca-activated chloride channel family protein